MPTLSPSKGGCEAQKELSHLADQPSTCTCRGAVHVLKGVAVHR